MIEIIGGPDRDRTDDLFHAMEARSQLRHRPTHWRDFSILSDAVSQVNRKPDLEPIGHGYGRWCHLQAALNRQCLRCSGTLRRFAVSKQAE